MTEQQGQIKKKLELEKIKIVIDLFKLKATNIEQKHKKDR